MHGGAWGRWNASDVAVALHPATAMDQIPVRCHVAGVGRRGNGRVVRRVLQVGARILQREGIILFHARKDIGMRVGREGVLIRVVGAGKRETGFNIWQIPRAY